MFSILKINYIVKNVPFVITILINEEEKIELQSCANIFDLLSPLEFNHESTLIEIIDLTSAEAEGYKKIYGEHTGFDTYFAFNEHCESTLPR